MFVPFTFIEHDPHIPSLHDLLNVSDGSILFFMNIRASKTHQCELQQIHGIVFVTMMVDIIHRQRYCNITHFTVTMFEQHARQGKTTITNLLAEL